MKTVNRILSTAFFLCLLFPALVLASGAAEDDPFSEPYSVRSLTVDADRCSGSAVVTAEKACTLIVALYDAEGRMLQSASVPVEEGASRQEVSAAFSRDIPDAFIAKAFLVDETCAPLCGTYALESTAALQLEVSDENLHLRATRSFYGDWDTSSGERVEKISWTACNDEFGGAYASGEDSVEAWPQIWNTQIALLPGNNRITFRAYTKSGLVSSVTADYRYDRGGLCAYADDEITLFDGERGVGYVNDVILVILRHATDPAAAKRSLEAVCGAVNGEVVGSVIGAGLYQIRVDKADYAALRELCVAALDSDQNVWDAAVDLLEPSPGGAGAPRTDSLSESGWWAEAVNAPKAWSFGEYFGPVRVGICDTGIDLRHEDLTIDKTLGGSSADDHGTHVAGILGAKADNGLGITGLLRNRELYSYGVCSGACTTGRYIDGVTALVEAGCKVVHCSSGGAAEPAAEGFLAEIDARCRSEFARKLLLNLTSNVTNQFLLVLPAGNGGGDPGRNGVFAPAAESMGSFVLLVAAAGKPEDGAVSLAPFSNCGSQVTLAAPGADILSTVVSGGPEAGYAAMDGTSMAAAMVSGAAAMVWSMDKEMTPEQVVKVLTETATTAVSSGEEGNGWRGSLLDIGAAVEYNVKSTAGRLIDNKTGEPIGNAKVELYCRSSYSVFKSAEMKTAADGSFLLRASAKAVRLSHITFSAEGYKDYTLQLEDDYELHAINDIGEVRLRPLLGFAGGTGTPEDPYRIETADQLDSVRDYPEDHFLLVKDLDLEAWGNWAPINDFSGSFDGGDHCISGLRISSIDGFYAGLFGSAGSGNIRALRMEDVDISLHFEAGLQGWIEAGAVAAFANSVSDCSVSGAITLTDTVRTEITLGGVVASALHAVENCTNYAEITVTAANEVDCGGISAHGSGESVVNCRNYGNIRVISDSSYANAGGICGYITSGSSIERCVNYGDVSALAKQYASYSDAGGNCNAGGIAGGSQSPITYCVNYGNIQGGAERGGTCYVGGIGGWVGRHFRAVISSCLNLGESILSRQQTSPPDCWDIDGVSGRIAGLCYDIENCYSSPAVTCNGRIPEDVGASGVHGADVTEAEALSLLADWGLSRP